MKGNVIIVVMLVILTLTTPAFAGGNEAEQAMANASDAAAYAVDRARDEASHMPEPPEQLGGPLMVPTPPESADDEEATEEPAEDEAATPAVPAPDADTSWAVAFLFGTLDDQASGRPAVESSAVTFIERTGSRAIETTITLLGELSTELEQRTAPAVARALDAIGFLLPPAATGHCNTCDDHTTTAATAAVGAAVITPANTAAVIAFVAASSLGAAFGAFALARKGLTLGGVAMLSRIQSKDIMKNETRASVFEIVKADPGVALNEIVERLGVSRNAVAYHLAVFESEQSIVSVKDGKYRRYFVNGGRFVNGAKDVVSALKNDTTRTVIDFISRHPGVIQKDVCAAIGTSPSATNWHIARLEKVGLVTKNKVANTVQYAPGPSVQKYDLQEFGLAAYA